MKRVYIFGAGFKGRELLGYLKCIYSEVEVIAFIDNDINKQGTAVDGVECIGISEAMKQGAQNEIILISPINNQEIKEQLKGDGFKKVFCTSEWISNRKEYFVPNTFEITDFKWARPFNNEYFSPYPDLLEVHKKESELFDRGKECLDIDFNINRQLELLENMKHIELPKWSNSNELSEKYRYCYKNSWFLKGSADALYYMMRIVKPHNIIEVGSGYSTAVMLDTNEFYLENKVNIISIEPNAGRLRERLKQTDRIELHEKKLQDIPVNFFEILGENDILFIDSSHISKIGSDVNYLFFEILPRLGGGYIFIFMMCTILLRILNSGYMRDKLGMSNMC